MGSKGQKQNCVTQRRSNFVKSSISFPFSQIWFRIAFSTLRHQLVSGRAGGEMTESRIFHLPDFMRWSPGCTQLQKCRNYIRSQDAGRWQGSTCYPPAPGPWLPSPQGWGDEPSLPASLCSEGLAQGPSPPAQSLL